MNIPVSVKNSTVFFPSDQYLGEDVAPIKQIIEDAVEVLRSELGADVDLEIKLPLSDSGLPDTEDGLTRYLAYRIGFVLVLNLPEPLTVSLKRQTPEAEKVIDTINSLAELEDPEDDG